MQSTLTQPTQLYKVCDLGQGAVFIMPKPNAEQLTADMQFYKNQGVSKILSLLLPEEIEKLNLQQQAKVCSEAGIKYQNFAIKDMSVPDIEDLKALLLQLKQEIAAGEQIAIHCHGGRGRAGTVVTTLLVEHGFKANQAIEITSKARGDNVPVNDLQTQFVLNYSN